MPKDPPGRENLRAHVVQLVLTGLDMCIALKTFANVHYEYFEVQVHYVN